MAKLTHEDILAYLEEATILELNDLVSAIEEKFGVTAAAPVAAAPAAEAAGAAHKLGGLSGLFFAYFVLSLPNGWIPQRRSSSTGTEGQHTIETSSIRARGSVSTVNRSKKALQNEKRLHCREAESYRR